MAGSITKGKAIEYLELYRDFIFNREIKTAIQCKCNNLAALGLSTYTEVLGGFYRGTLAPRNSHANYDAFILNFFPTEYDKVERRLAKNKKLMGLYEAVRCNLVHEHLMRDTLIIKIVSHN